MKNLVKYLTESGELIDDLNQLVEIFNELFDKTPDDDKEMLCQELVQKTIKGNKRCKECWDYVFSNYSK